MSHPAWVCGLKHAHRRFFSTLMESHPAWVCGLKRYWQWKSAVDTVTPCVGVWIETRSKGCYRSTYKRHTLRGCVD